MELLDIGTPPKALCCPQENKENLKLPHCRTLKYNDISDI